MSQMNKLYRDLATGNTSFSLILFFMIWEILRGDASKS